MEIGPNKDGYQPENVYRQVGHANHRRISDGPNTEPEDQVEMSEAARLKAPGVENLKDATQTLEEIRRAAGNIDGIESGTTGKLKIGFDLETMRAEKVEEARRRIEEGFYNNAEVWKVIARRVIDDFLR